MRIDNGTAVSAADDVGARLAGELAEERGAVSVGARGGWLTGGPRGARATVGAPGTGLFWTERIPAATPPNARHQASFGGLVLLMRDRGAVRTRALASRIDHIAEISHHCRGVPAGELAGYLRRSAREQGAARSRHKTAVWMRGLNRV